MCFHKQIIYVTITPEILFMFSSKTYEANTTYDYDKLCSASANNKCRTQC